MMLQSSSDPNAPVQDNELLRADFLSVELPSQYQLLERVSQGGMGLVFRAVNRYTEAPLAIKLMRNDTADANAIDRFKLEAKIAYTLRHPNICAVHDFGLTPDRVPYIVMDWLNGITLLKKILRDKRVTVAEGIPIFQQVVGALAYAHQRKLVHRDLKPDNVMLSRDTTGKSIAHVLDFGIAKVLNEDLASQNLTKTGVVVGTPLYMSPEQGRGFSVDERSDIYSLGCMMYFAFTGTPPFVGATSIDTLKMHIMDPPPKFDPALKLPKDLKMIILRCMEKEPEDRYQSMEEIGLDLKKLLKGVTIEHAVLSTERQSKRKRFLTLTYFAVGFVLTYLASMALQNWMDQCSANPAQMQHAKKHPHHTK